VTSPWSDLERPPLRQASLRRALVTDLSLWSDVQVVLTSASTNADVVAAARGGASEGLVVVAEQQTTGRGRLDRAWTSPARAGLTFSFLLRPTFPVAAWGWLPLLTGLAVAGPLRRLSGLDVRLKWPNDVLAGDRKLGGILTEVAHDTAAVVAGVGLNVSLRADELPVPTATSLAIEGSDVVDREPVLLAVLRETERWYGELARAGGDAAACGLRDAYVQACSTLGRQVRVALPGTRELEGSAADIDESGRLVVAGADGRETVAAGDVVHVR
jgi:BirA family transcriptional regulator, biotin operon repressor / biotin---[acetyl-CoA-carboxylase] ligase